MESLDNPFPSGGFKIGGHLSHRVFGRRWSGDGDVTGHVLLDGRIPEQSKVAINVESGWRYTVSPTFHSIFQFTHFNKAFLLQDRKYRWSEAFAGMGVTPSQAVSAEVGLGIRTTRFTPSETFRFTDRMLNLNLDYAVTERVTVRVAGILGRIDYANFHAFALSSDSTLVRLDFDQEDQSMKGRVHLHYRGKVILGIQAAVQSVNSNSVIGEFDLGTYRLYVSGRLGRLNFFHLVHQRVDKRYRYPGIPGRSGFRDPEERIQNRTYLQLERTAAENTVLFLQVSLLENETVWNQQYYDKTLAELGIRSTF